MSAWKRFVGAACLSVLVPALGGAQPAQTGTLSGVIKDSSGALLPGAAVTATSQERGFTRQAVADAEGRFVFPAIPIGTYTVTASLDQFETVKAKDNLVETDKTTHVGLALKVGTMSDTLTVTGETPIVDITNTTANLRVRRDAFETLPVGRSYQALIGTAPGVVGTGNVFATGALDSNNLFLMDGLDTTDPTTGTFGTNMNYETIQEVSVSTSGVSVEYGRAVGAVINVITRSGTNRFEGSAKYIATNDDWNAQNTTRSETTGQSLERAKFDHVNPVYTFTLGGPVLKDRAWFFTAYERSTNTTPQRQTRGQIPEDYQQTTKSNFLSARVTTQIAENHSLWVKYFRSPTDGFINDYWGAATPAAERAALTLQNQTATNWGVQWSGVLRSNWAMEASAGDYESELIVTTFEEGRHSDNAPHLNLAENKYYNGATFDGFTKRPRQQLNVASTWFTRLGRNNHNFKAGFDFQRVKSGAQFDFPNRQLYNDDTYDQASGTFAPSTREDYQGGDSTSKGNIYALYLRDKFEAGKRLHLEVGLRLEKQTGDSDIGATTIDTTTLVPRLSASFDVSGDGKTVALATYGRYDLGLLQSFSDAFAGVPQQTNYDNYTWNGSAYTLSNQVRLGASNFQPNTGLESPHLDEFTLGFQRQIGQSLRVEARGILRNWGNFYDDVISFNPDGTTRRVVMNYDAAERTYRGLQFIAEKRFAGGWNAQGSYTYSRTRGNYFANNFSALGDYTEAQCRTTTDPTIGTGGIIPCSEVQDGPNKSGRPAHDRPHNLKLNGRYDRRFGRLTLSAGTLFDGISKRTFTKTRPVNVLLPGTTTSAATATYNYEPLGSDRVSGLEWTADTSLEATWRLRGRTNVGLKAEAFNVTNREEKIRADNFTWCNTTSTAACQTAVNNFGKATARGSFQEPRRFRLSAIFRF
jgi:hypothetical protein